VRGSSSAAPLLWSAAALAVLAALPLVASAYSPPKAPASQQTHPRVHPSRGGRHTTFVVTLTAGDDLGVRGVLQTDYRLVVSSHAHSGCVSAFDASIISGRKRQRLTLDVARGAGPGWCRGRYSGVVLLERGPYCPKPAPGQPPQPCPEFASQALDVGRFGFRVR
jgi:hypothetical protein